MADSNEERYVRQIGRVFEMAKQIGLKVCEKDYHYRSSWRKRDGVGAWFTIVRKWDRIEAAVEATEFCGYPVTPYDFFQRFEVDQRGESMVNDTLDLIGYLLITLEHMLELGYVRSEQIAAVLEIDDLDKLRERLEAFKDGPGANDWELLMEKVRSGS